MGVYQVSPFKSPITFSITAEDFLSVEKALEIQSQSTILCVASSGDTPINLLRNNPKQIIAVDINPAQVHLAELKLVGLQNIDRVDFGNLLGCTNAENAVDIYNAIRLELSEQGRSFWDNHLRLIRKGVLWQGSIQKMLTMSRKLLFLILGKKGMQDLKEVGNKVTADDFVKRHLGGFRFRFVSWLLFNRLTYQLFYPKIGFKHLPNGMSAYEFSLEKIRMVLRSRPIFNNPYMIPYIFGKYDVSPDQLPPYLNPAYQQDIKSQLHKVEFHICELSAFLRESRSDLIDGFALCNVMDWMSQEELGALLKQVVRVSKPQGNVIIFSRTHRLIIPNELQGTVKLDETLTSELSSTDRTYYQYANVLRIDKTISKITHK